MTDAVQNNQERIIRGAINYAAADKSDPFTFGRAMAHIKMGLCRPLKDGSDGHYDATPDMEKRVTSRGDEYLVTVYRNVARP